MTKVKFGSNQEVDYIANWKVLQKAFKAAGVEKVRLAFDRFIFTVFLIRDKNVILIGSKKISASSGNRLLDSVVTSHFTKYGL